MIVNNPGIRGTIFADNTIFPDNANGVPTRASEILPSTLNWIQTLNVLPKTDSFDNGEKFPVTFLSQCFDGSFAQAIGTPLTGPAAVTVFEFSPNATAIGGY